MTTMDAIDRHKQTRDVAVRWVLMLSRRRFCCSSCCWRPYSFPVIYLDVDPNPEKCCSNLYLHLSRLRLRKCVKDPNKFCGRNTGQAQVLSRDQKHAALHDNFFLEKAKPH